MAVRNTKRMSFYRISICGMTVPKGLTHVSPRHFTTETRPAIHDHLLLMVPHDQLLLAVGLVGILGMRGVQPHGMTLLQPIWMSHPTALARLTRLLLLAGEAQFQCPSHQLYSPMPMSFPIPFSEAPWSFLLPHPPSTLPCHPTSSPEHV